MKNICSMTMVDRIIGSAPFVYEGDFCAGVAEAARLGYGGVEVHIANPAELPVEALQDALQEHGLQLTAIGTGRAYVNEGLSLTAPDKAGREQAMARLAAFIDVAAVFGSKIIIGCMRGNISSDAELPQALERLAEGMVELDKLAGEKNVKIVFEPINRYENNFLCNMDEIAAFIEQNDLKHTGILIDTFHMNIEEGDYEDIIRKHGDKIKYMHAADSNRKYPGCGHIPFDRILRTLQEVGYEDPISAECLPLPTKTEAAAGWLKAMKAY